MDLRALDDRFHRRLICLIRPHLSRITNESLVLLAVEQHSVGMILENFIQVLRRHPEFFALRLPVSGVKRKHRRHRECCKKEC